MDRRGGGDDAACGRWRVGEGRRDMSRLRTVLALLVAGFSLAAFVAGTAVAAPFPPLPVDPFWLVWAGFPVVGAIIVVKRPENLVGLIQLGIGLCAAISAFTSVLFELGVDPSWPVLINQVAFMPIFVLLPLLILVFPAGQLPSRRWRPYVGIALAVCALLMVWFAVRPVDYSVDGVTSHPNPLGIDALAGYDALVLGVLRLALILFAVAVLTQAVIAYRRADRIRRLQVKWVVAPALFMPPLFILGTVLEDFGPRSLELSNLVTMSAILVGGNGIAAGIGVAVFRHRLYGIDKIVSRTVSYAVLVTVLGLAYMGLVAALTAFLAPDDPVVVAIGTLAVAALFNPVRRRVQSWVDRRFNRPRYDAEALIGQFTESLRDPLETAELVEGWLGVVSETMQPASATVWVRE
jgi:hypothetical protein